MGTLLKTYPSKSKPGKAYQILEPNGGGDPYCDCPGWKFSKENPRVCKHLEAYHREMQTPQHVNKGVSMPVEVDEPIDGDPMDDIEQAIQDVLGRVSVN